MIRTKRRCCGCGFTGQFGGNNWVSRLMDAVEARARELGFTEAFLDTSTDQPEAMDFYRALGNQEVGRETRPSWHWTLVYFQKAL